MEEKSTTNESENRRLLGALAASIKSLDPRLSESIKMAAHLKHVSMVIDVLTMAERKPGLHVEAFKLIALAKRAITSGQYKEYWDANARFEGLIQ